MVSAWNQPADCDGIDVNRVFMKDHSINNCLSLRSPERGIPPSGDGSDSEIPPFYFERDLWQAQPQRMGHETRHPDPDPGQRGDSRPSE